jgi:hypothetical protein
MMASVSEPQPNPSTFAMRPSHPQACQPVLGADQYRIKAAEFFARAKSAPSESVQVEYAAMAASYLRVAEQAEVNASTDHVYETPPRASAVTRQLIRGCEAWSVFSVVPERDVELKDAASRSSGCKSNWNRA